jgi:hypothetical protein
MCELNLLTLKNMQGTPTKVRTTLVLFDVGGVIIDLDFHDARRTLKSEFLMDPGTFSGAALQMCGSLDLEKVYCGSR